MDGTIFPENGEDSKKKKKIPPPYKYKCFLCKISYDRNGSCLGFIVPTDDERRQRWSLSCGVNLPVNARVCENHFTALDFIIGPSNVKRARLQPGAVPKPLGGNFSNKFPYANEVMVGALNNVGYHNLEEPLIDILPKQDDIINPKKYCLICLKTNADKVSLHGVPQNEKYCKLWCEKLGKDLLHGTHICANHFRHNDFTIFNKQIHLKDEAIPTQNLKGFCKSKSSTNVLYINQPSQIEYVELPGSCIAETNNIEKNLTQIKMQENINILSGVFAKRTMSSKSIQTNVGYIRTCGYIEVTSDNQLFSMNCFYCDDTFPIWSWSDFVTHVRELHQREEENLRTDFLNNQETETILPSTSKVQSIENNLFLTQQNNEENTEKVTETVVPDLGHIEAVTDVSEAVTNSQNLISNIQMDNFDTTEPDKWYSNFDSSSETDNKCDNENSFKKLIIKKERKKIIKSNKKGNITQHKVIAAETTETSSTTACYHCEKLFCNVTELKDHQLVCYNKQQHARREQADRYCTLCNKLFTSPCYYRKHMKNHKPPSLKCHICHKPFRWQPSLDDHIKLHSNQRDHVCELCGQAFLRRQKLFEHKQLKHSDEYSYKCGICGHTCKTSSRLSMHRKKFHFVLEGTIEELAKYINHPGRNKVNGYTNSKYKSVQDPVTKKMILKCDLCDKTYGRPTHVSRHKAKVHGVICKRRKINY